MKQNILFLGCGKMGAILLHNLIEEKSALASEIKVIKPTNKKSFSAEIKCFKDAGQLPKNYQADLVFLTIKPQESAKVLAQFANNKIFHSNTIFISILAGKKITFFEKIFGKKAKIVRAMPNLPTQYSQGIFAYLCNQNIKKLELKKLEKIFNKFGAIIELESENLFNVITAIFGSGPAYIFLLQEIFYEIAQSHKIKKEQALELTKQLFLGSALMSCNSEIDFENLRQDVTSKGGTTEAALKILQKNSALKNLFKKALNAAIDQSKKLA
ncbi:MAG: pyrroline-5-carboxylate reductase [Rickettsiales bacterium]|nr:pyrroline-5-carboxylate reductase [Rickettsiales bacterium]